MIGLNLYKLTLQARSDLADYLQNQILGQWAAGVFIILLFVSTAFNGQDMQALSQIGAIAHVLSILAAIFLISLSRNSFESAALIVFVGGGLKYFDDIEIIRHIYEWFLYLILFCAGAVVIVKFRNIVENVFLSIVILSLVMVIGQILGLHDGLFVHSKTHAWLKEIGYSVELSSPLFASAADLQSTMTQLRPHGVFSSSTILSLFVLFVFAVFVSSKEKRYLAIVATTALAVLTMSKSLIIGVPVIAIFSAIFFRNCRWALAPMSVAIAATLGLYALTMPGVVSLYLSPRAFIVSFGSRVADILESIGLHGFVDQMIALFAEQDGEDGEFEGRILRSLERWEYLAQPSDAVPGGESLESQSQQTDRIEFSGAGALTLYSAMLAHPAQTLSVGALAAVSCLWGRLKDVKFCDRILSSTSVILLLSLAMSGLIHNFAGLGLFWMFCGMAVPWIAGHWLRFDVGPSAQHRLSR